MRITNRMMTNNMLYNINNNKHRLNKLDEQYATGKRIQRPSDDPIIAVRALKLRTNLSELDQYYEKNIPDAMSWMETTESALQVANQIVTKLHTYCVQGANDPLTEKDRESIVTNLRELKEQIYQEGNTNYAGRYVFSGYKTDRSLVFQEATSNLNYTLTEKLNGQDIKVVRHVIHSNVLENLDMESPDDYDTEVKPSEVTAYQIRLAYGDLKSIEKEGSIAIRMPELDEYGNLQYDEDTGEIIYGEELTDSDMNVTNSYDPLAYVVEPGMINYLEDTGELIFSEDIYQAWQQTQFHITYQKDNFQVNDLRPEHYFDSVVYDNTIEDDDEREEKTIYYKKEAQEIAFEVNFSQTIAINTEGSNSITHALGRSIENMLFAVNEVIHTETNIAKVKDMLTDENMEEEQVAKLNAILESLNTELVLKNNVMQSAFSRGLSDLEVQQDILNVAIADTGTRYNRLELTEGRLSKQQTEFTDLLSTNEDADMVDTIINFKAMQSIYNASLSAASKVVQNTLLDFL